MNHLTKKGFSAKLRHHVRWLGSVLRRCRRERTLPGERLGIPTLVSLCVSTPEDADVKRKSQNPVQSTQCTARKTCCSLPNTYVFHEICYLLWLLFWDRVSLCTQAGLSHTTKPRMPSMCCSPISASRVPCGDYRHEPPHWAIFFLFENKHGYPEDTDMR